LGLDALGGQPQGVNRGAGGTGKKEHTLPKLPYAYDALEPYIDEQTMHLHHDKHHSGYVKGLNKAEKMLTAARDKNDFTYIQHWSRKAAFTGAGHFLHTLFWETMGPANKNGGKPKGAIADKIKIDFGSFEKFQAHFGAAAKSVEGSGWSILHYRLADDKLLILQEENHQKLSEMMTIPILCVDVWEHAYYLKYQNKRGDFIKAWWNVVNWQRVDELLKAVRG